jgi:hypothetical protein
MASSQFQQYYPRSWTRSPIVLIVALVARAEPGSAEALARAESLKIAESFIQHRWQSSTKKRAVFYEAAPFSKTLASERDVSEMTAGGYQPLRYRQIRN